ncbi:DUF3795 domain-containing protein [Thermodesulfobacteriota bacterium]
MNAKIDETKQKLLAPCSLYCGVCGFFVAYRENDRGLKEKMAKFYGCSPEEVVCEGCFSDKRFKHCEVCAIRACASEKNIEGCHRCEEFPCRLIDDFSQPIAKKFILEGVPARKRLGKEKWVEEEENRYRCSKCGTIFFRGASYCTQCQIEIKG